jgi:hypothetical protein
MQRPRHRPRSSSTLRRYGPIIAIVAVIAIIAVVVVATRSSDDKTATAGSTTTTAGGAREGVVSWSQARPRARPTRPTGVTALRYRAGEAQVPELLRGECYAKFTGDNGGATAIGVTGDSIKVVFYQAQESDPILNYITSR